MTENVPGRSSEFLLYQTDDGATRVQARFTGDKLVMSRHIRNVFDEGELPYTEATVAKFATVQREGSREITREVDKEEHHA